MGEAGQLEHLKGNTVTLASIYVDTDAKFDVAHADSAPTVRCGEVSLFLQSRCQLERLAVAIDEALHGGDCDPAYAEHGGEAGGP